MGSDVLRETAVERIDPCGYNVVKTNAPKLTMDCATLESRKVLGKATPRICQRIGVVAR